MTWFDLLILAVLAISVASAFVRGFLLELFSLAGLVLGLLIASEEYAPVARWLENRSGSWTKGVMGNQDVASLVAFLLLALSVMLVTTLVGRLLRGTARHVGLGFVDRVLGAGLGFVKGCAVLTLVVMAITAFMPQADCLKRSRLAPYFLQAAHQASRVTPVELGDKVREGVGLLRTATSR